MRAILYSIFSILVLATFCLASIRNITVDDTLGDPLTGRGIFYLPQWDLGKACDSCASTLDGTKTRNATWHNSTFLPGETHRFNATMNFNGSAIYVYCVLMNSLEFPTGRSDMSFYIDGDLRGNFTREPASTDPPFEYDVLVFSADSLPAREHTLLIINGHRRDDGGQASLAILDYLVYTYHDDLSNPQGGVATVENSPSETAGATASLPISSGPFPPSSSYTSTAISASNDGHKKVVGAVVGTLMGILFVLLAFLFYRLYRRRRRTPKSTNSPPQRPHALGRWLGIGGPSSAISPNSFNPSLFVRKVARKATILSPRRARPVSHRPPTDFPYLIDPPPLESPRAGNFAAYMADDPRSARIASIHAWQRHTAEQTQGLQLYGPIDRNEEMSSYYEQSPTESRRVRTPPPAPRRFAVMNN